MRRWIALLAALLLGLPGQGTLASHTPLPPPEGSGVRWWGQFPDLVATDIEFQQRGEHTYLFAASMGFGFRVFDITDRAHPALVGVYLSPSYQNDIQVQGELVVLSSDLPPYPGDPHHVVSDERGGGVSELGCPGGGLHVYDLTSEAKPWKLGVYFAPDTRPHGNCTVHNFRFLPDRDVLTTAWYGAGSWVVDLSGPAPSGELDNRSARPGQKTTWGRTLGYAVMPGADTWSTKSPGPTPDGRLFMYTGDMVRGMDVFELVDPLPPADGRRHGPRRGAAPRPPAAGR